MTKRHTLAVLVENKPGVLTRVAALFARRTFNIKSLTVGETEHPEFSRMTIIVDADSAPIEQVVKQLNKLINVLKVVELEPGDSIERRPAHDEGSGGRNPSHLGPADRGPVSRARR